MDNIGTILKKGIFINFIANYSNIFIQIIITSILARLLTPKEFGVIAIVLVFITFFTMLGDMGLGPAIIQNKDLKQKEIFRHLYFFNNNGCNFIYIFLFFFIFHRIFL